MALTRSEKIELNAAINELVDAAREHQAWVLARQAVPFAREVEEGFRRTEQREVEARRALRLLVDAL